MEMLGVWFYMVEDYIIIDGHYHDKYNNFVPRYAFEKSYEGDE